MVAAEREQAPTFRQDRASGGRSVFEISAFWLTRVENKVSEIRYRQVGKDQSVTPIVPESTIGLPQIRRHAAQTRRGCRATIPIKGTSIERQAEHDDISTLSGHTAEESERVYRVRSLGRQRFSGRRLDRVA